jgi:hypothetical protein
MKGLRLFFVFFLFGIGLAFGYFLYSEPRLKQQPIQPITSKTNILSTFSILLPPSESLKGSITSRNGTVLWESRISTSPSRLLDNVQIGQGERLITEEKSSATVNFDQVGLINLSENSDLSFVQTLPVDFVVEQKKGTVKYEVAGKIPLSIRIRNALITKETGIINVTMTDEDPVVLISTVQGTALIGFNDLDNVSRVFTLREGQIYEYNSDERTAINSENK